MIAIIIIAIIILIILLLSISSNSVSEENKSLINLAVAYIEEAYHLATNSSLGLGNSAIITIYKNNYNNDLGCDIALYANEKSESVVQSAIGDRVGWHIQKDEYGDIYLLKHVISGIKGNWNNYNKEVWNTIKNKHPDWNVKYVRSDKSVITI